MEAIPNVGLGTWKIAKDKAADAVYTAIKEVGMRHIDCACDYGNEVEVGQGIARAISEGVVKREELWITSKLWNTFHAPEHVEMACRKSLTDLGLDYVDLYLIHFPISMKFVPIETRYPPEWIHDPSAASPRIERVKQSKQETWRAMEALVGKGLARFIGVCNYNVQLLTDLVDYAVVQPYCLQVELHPYLPQQALIDECVASGIKVVAFSPLGSPSYVELGMDQKLGGGLLEEASVKAIAAKHGKTPAQVILRWNLQRGVGVIPKSSQVAHLKENFAVSDFTIADDDMASLTSLGARNSRFNDPGVFCAFMGGAIPIYA